MRILMTGATGFFGKSLFHYIPELHDHEIVIIGRRPVSSTGYITYIIDDVRTFSFPKGEFDYIYHGAAPSSSVDLVPDDEMSSIIVDGTKRVVEFAKTQQAKLLFVSSGAVYGMHRSLPNALPKETDPCSPDTEYGKAKVEAEQMIQSELKNYCIARCFSFVGEYMPLQAHFAMTSFIRACLENIPIVIHDGSPLRSYMFSSDLAYWLWELMMRGEGIFNVGAPGMVSISELAQLVRTIAGTDNELQLLNTSHVPYPYCYVPSIRKGLDFGLTIKVMLADAIRKTIEFHRRVDENFRLHYRDTEESQ